MNVNQFVEELKKININITCKQLDQFEKYYEILVEWNKNVNLTAITKKSEVYEKHFYDCLLVSQVYDFNNQNICDVGAGAGFPSIPLKIIFPKLKITIVDSLDKRIKFLNHLILELSIEDVKTVSSRAEEFAIANRESFDVVMGRAVARLNILDELCLPLVKIGGYFIALKGMQGKIEHDEAKIGIKELGAKLISLKKYYLISDDSVRYLLLYKKNYKTKMKYPRNFSQIKKKPL